MIAEIFKFNRGFLKRAAVCWAIRSGILCFALLFGAITQSGAAPFTPLHGFAGAPSDGAKPQFGSLATDGTLLYGFTFNGGVSNKGVVFKINSNGTGYQVLHSFIGPSFANILLSGSGNINDGANPYGTPLLIGSTLYGMTLNGGTNGTGTIFKMNTDGSGFELLHSFGAGFGPRDGYAPSGSLVTDGTTLYGMTFTSLYGQGTIFSIGTNGSNYAMLYEFGLAANDGANPAGSLTISGGTLYGMTQIGGVNGLGTIFQIGPGGSGFQLVHSFSGGANDGANPYGSLIISNSILYGTTGAGGSGGVGTVFKVGTGGSDFQILHSFSLATAWRPMGDLTLSNSTLFGMTSTNSAGFGTIFRVDTDGSDFQVVHTFSYAAKGNSTDGSAPFGSLLLLGSQLYGMTENGGSSHNLGSLFSFDANASINGSIGGLKVNLLPSGAVKAGAEWQVDGGSFFKSGAIVTNLSPGTHTVSFKPIKGWAEPDNQLVTVTLGSTNTITGTYVELDVTKPTLKVLTPTSGLRVNTSIFTANGTISDGGGVAEVFYQLNAGAWITAATLNNWTNWSAADLNLVPGPNVIKVYARDLAGNVSTTNTVSFTFVVSAQLIVSTNGAGSIKPDLNGELLEIGKSFTMSAKAAKGYAFVNWTGSATTTSTKLTFTMASNLTFTASFKDTARPVDPILSPTKNQTVTNSAPVATGKAMDNTGVATVWFRVNEGGWLPANLLDGTNWHTPSLSPFLLSGPNTIGTYALDAAGNASLTNTIAFNYKIEPMADWAPDSLNGLVASVTPANSSPEAVGFDISTFAQSSTVNNTNADDYGAGTYTYLKIDTNLAQLSLAVTTPPASSNSVGPVDLIFTNHYVAYFSNEASGDIGGFALRIATNLFPATVAGKTLTAVSDGDGKTAKIKLGKGVTFTKTPSNNSSSGSSSGNYAFTRFNPICGVFAFAFTDIADAGQIACVQTTFVTATSGTYFVMSFDSLGGLQDVDAGQFTLK
jgi:uncharacterized repeat protein (TIGR02543 family)